MTKQMPHRTFGFAVALSLAIFFSADSAVGFITPLSFIVKDVFEGRRGSAPVEVSMHHRLEIRAGEFVEFDERLFYERGRISCLWTGTALGQAVGASYAAMAYTAGDKTYPTRSAALIKYLLMPSSDEFKETLISEQLARREQFQQYRSGINLTGDPQGWDMKQVYFSHPDIFLTRTATGASVTVVGLGDGALRKAVSFDKGQRGVSRLEWKTADQTVAWEFEEFTKSLDGTIPKRAYFENAGKPAIVTSIAYRRLDSERQANEFRSGWKQARNNAVSGNADAVLRALLGYR